jgi:DNA-binding SARP family transcriptional activator/ABC-type glycerol-3-phosphate transport system substrate-binding protein
VRKPSGGLRRGRWKTLEAISNRLPFARPAAYRALMRFLLLGPLEARDDGRALTLGGPKQRTVLAHLLLQANRVVSTERLIDAIWGEEPPATARNTLQTYIRHLRRAVGTERIQHRSSGYVLHADPQEVDVLQFQGLIEESRALAAADLPAAITSLVEALALWRGPALDDLSQQSSLRSEIARLEETRLAALGERIEAELELGRHREVVAELEILIDRHRFRERLWGNLVMALYRSGRQGDAINAYQRARTVLAEELGIDPSPELQRLHEQVLRQDPALDLGGERLRGYRLLEQIGEGSFGTVYRAFQPEVGREVAVKVMGPRIADLPEFIRRFDVEAQLIARLEHPHIVPLHDYWREPDGAYVVMRYLRGGSLRHALTHGPLETDRAVRITDQIALALAAAHRSGVIHRALKPANILFDEDGNAFLSDFGIAKDLAALRVGDDRGAPSPFAYYMSPEEARGEALTQLADIYCLGIVVYEALTGRHPFADTRPVELLDVIAREPLPPARSLRPELSASVDEVIARATAPDPSERYGDVLELASALREALTAAPIGPLQKEDLQLRNPYKGLHAFDEADAGDFFGREASVEELVAMMAEGTAGNRFLAVVGPSGSGKSSVVRAGLIPALRGGAVPGSDEWFVVDMVPGAHPFDELAAALVRIAVDPGPAFAERLRRDDGDLVRVAGEVLPPDGSELLLVIDQFEELFSLVSDEEQRARFLAAIVAAASDPESRVRVVVTLRADFYDRPLQYRGFGELLAGRTYATAPLSIEELEQAVSGPAEAVGLGLDPALLTEIVAEVAGRPGGLPLLQYALTELFEGRPGPTLTLESYRRVGGVSGALARRAEALYERLDQGGKEATRQLLLRLVTVGESGSESTRRRVLQSELTSLGVEHGSMTAAMDAFGARRLLAFDRDPRTRGPTVEVAHEALLGEWARLRDWIEASREELRLHGRLSFSASEWMEAGRSDDYLLTGDRLTQAEEGIRTGSVKLTGREREYLGASRARAESEEIAEGDRRAREVRLERRSLVRLRALVAVLAAASLVAASLAIVVVNRSREADLQNRRETVGRLTAGSIASLDSHPQLSLSLALHAVNEASGLGDPVPAATVEALHWAIQEAGIQYPDRSGPVKLVAGPLGTRGMFDLPLARLTGLAQAQVTRQLGPRECVQYFGEPTCPSLPKAFSPGLQAEPIRAVAPSTPGEPLSGTQVTFFTHFDPESTRATDFESQIEPFTARTGIEVRLVSIPEFDQWIGEEAPIDDPPDIAYFQQPGGLVSLARRGYLADLGVYLDLEQLRADTSPYLVSLGTIGRDGSWPSTDGATYGAFAHLALKSLIWYPVPEYRSAGYAIPGTWDELIAVSERLVADGQTPWCMGFESGVATGWPGTDWIENLLLAGAGPETYDDWTFHRIPFDSPEVRDAFEHFGGIAFADGYVRGGAEKGAGTWIGEAQLPMVRRDPPGCWLHGFPSFAAQFLPPGSVPRETNVFPFPTLTERSPRAMIGGGDMIGAFADRPEVREAVQFLLSTQFRAGSSEPAEGLIVANRRFDVESYPPFWRHQARLIYASLASDTFRFDASDLMPPEIGQGLFWRAMTTYMAEGPESLDGILAELDASWPGP